MRRLRSERGIALVPAIMTMAIVLVLGTVLLAAVNVQTHQTASERAKEASFRLAESALNSTVLQLTRIWPDTVAKAYPACNQASTPSATCIGTALASNYTTLSGGSPAGGTDFGVAPTWSSRVIDDEGGPEYYDDALATKSPAPCACDLKGSATSTANGSVWVRTTATVGGQKSVLIVLVAKNQPRLEAFPRNAVTAGFFRTTNTGKKVIADVKGSSATPGNIAVRCATTTPSSGNSCLGFDPAKGQLSPSGAYQSSYVDNTGTANAIDSAALARLKARAQSTVPSSYYATGCPSTLTGAIIYIESATCSFSGSSFNSAAAPGFVIFANGSLSLGGNSKYYGLIYNANTAGAAPPCTSTNQTTLVSLSGNSSIQGAVVIDKCGGMSAGSSGRPNFVYDSNVFGNAISIGAAAGVKGTFRILPSP